jgi:Zn-dependent peptidase ImmA (M78 family)
MLPECTREELAAGMDAVVMEILAEAGIRTPPVDAWDLARRLGIMVAVDEFQEGRARYVRLRGHGAARNHPTILVRPDDRRERQHWAVAHEIGEHAAYRVFAVWGADPRETPARAREDLANCLAGRFLLPSDWFAADGLASGWDLLWLKARYATASHELIARRMLECRPAAIITIFDQRAISFRRSNLPGRVPPLSAAEQECWQAVHDENCPRETRSGFCRVQGWPVHEPGWQREILRAEVEEYPADW